MNVSATSSEKINRIDFSGHPTLPIPVSETAWHNPSALDPADLVSFFFFQTWGALQISEWNGLFTNKQVNKVKIKNKLKISLNDQIIDDHFAPFFFFLR